MRTVYGYSNAAYYNRKPEGDERWFESREERDVALETLRRRAIRHGLGESSARSGIIPLIWELEDETDEAEFQDILEEQEMRG